MLKTVTLVGIAFLLLAGCVRFVVSGNDIFVERKDLWLDIVGDACCPEQLKANKLACSQEVHEKWEPTMLGRTRDEMYVKCLRAKGYEVRWKD